jgi:hypothetical protein
MQAEERSFATMMQEIVGSIREIVRLEIKLARTEIGASIMAMRQAAVLLSAGIVALLFGVVFLLLAAVYALSLVMPPWAAALVVGGTIAVVAVICIAAAMKRMRVVGMPKRTIATLQENLS